MDKRDSQILETNGRGQRAAGPTGGPIGAKWIHGVTAWARTNSIGGNCIMWWVYFGLSFVKYLDGHSIVAKGF